MSREYKGFEEAYRAMGFDPSANGRSKTITDSETSSADDFGFDTDHTGGGFGRNKSVLPIKTVSEVLEDAGQETDWICEGVLTPGDVTDLNGLAKDSGKTTLVAHMLADIFAGEDFCGLPTRKAKAIWLSEQGNNLVNVLRDSGLASHAGDDDLAIIQHKDVWNVKWSSLIKGAAEACRERGAEILVVDTFAAFSGMVGTEENNAGDVHDRMVVLRKAAQRYKLAILYVRHAGKDGSARGSSQFEADADILLNLGKPEGNHADNVRCLTGKGRHDDIPTKLNIKLTDYGYRALGSDDDIIFKKAVRLIKDTVPYSPEKAIGKSAILDACEETGDKVSKSTLDRALRWLQKKDVIVEREESHKRGKPKVYWQAYEPPGAKLPEDGSERDDVYFDQTPSLNNRNKEPKRDGAAKSGNSSDPPDYDEMVNERMAGLAPCIHDVPGGCYLCKKKRGDQGGDAA